MELGQLIRQARQEAGLSQRALCGDVITRNMLSQIENGSARPSMDTLRYLAGQLGKPISYFLGEMPEISPNQALMLEARQAQGTRVLAILEHYQQPDPIFDPERYLLEARTCLALAELAIGEKKDAYARQLLEQAREAGEKTPYYTQQDARLWLLLQHQAGGKADAIRLPSLEPELLLRAQAALDAEDPQQAGKWLDAVSDPSAGWHYLRAKAWEAQEEYEKAVQHYLQAQGPNLDACLERCYKALGDYKMAYEYACKQR